MYDILKLFYNACNPLKPADKNQYVDADDVRGSRDFSRQFLRELNNIEGDFLTFLFTGHTGCGKSSELYHLAEQLRNPAPNMKSPRYFPIILDAEEFVDSYDVTPTDVLLSILARAAQEMKKIGIELQDRFLYRRLAANLDFAKDLFLSEIGAPSEIGAEGIVPLAKVTAKFPLLKSDPTNRQAVRAALGRDTSALKTEIQDQFEKARLKLSKAKGPNGEVYKDFVLILDNLEKIDRVQGQDDGYKSHRQFFIDSASQLMELGVHVVYTVPLPLVIHDGSELATRYGNRPFVLPMIKVEERPPKRKAYEDGREKLRAILQRRAGKTPLASLIAPDALNFLISSCGGHTRQLMMFIRSAISQTDSPPIGLREAQQAIADTVDLYSRMQASYWPKLAGIELSLDQTIDSGDDDVKAMLQQLIILEYRNGGDREDPVGANVPWYAVHPLVRQLPAFKRAVGALRPKGARKRSHAPKASNPRSKR